MSLRNGQPLTPTKDKKQSKRRQTTNDIKPSKIYDSITKHSKPQNAKHISIHEH